MLELKVSLDVDEGVTTVDDGARELVDDREVMVVTILEDVVEAGTSVEEDLLEMRLVGATV